MSLPMTPGVDGYEVTMDGGPQMQYLTTPPATAALAGVTPSSAMTPRTCTSAWQLTRGSVWRS